jgi:hypothetical protein
MEEPTDLNDQQRARADALVIAARLLKGPGTMVSTSGLPESRTTTDLVDLAEYILTGTKPLEGWMEGDGTGVALPPYPESTPGDNPGDGRPDDEDLT